jgi:hypothetical protein
LVLAWAFLCTAKIGVLYWVTRAIARADARKGFKNNVLSSKTKYKGYPHCC